MEKLSYVGSRPSLEEHFYQLFRTKSNENNPIGLNSITDKILFHQRKSKDLKKGKKFTIFSITITVTK